MKRTLTAVAIAALALVAIVAMPSASAQPAERSTPTACPTPSLPRMDGTAAQRDVDCLVTRVAGLEGGTRQLRDAVDRLSTADDTADLAALQATVAQLAADNAALTERVADLEAERIIAALHPHPLDVFPETGQIVHLASPHTVDRSITYTLRSQLDKPLTITPPTIAGLTFSPTSQTWTAGETGARSFVMTFDAAAFAEWPTSQRYYSQPITPRVTYGTVTGDWPTHWLLLNRD